MTLLLLRELSVLIRHCIGQRLNSVDSPDDSRADADSFPEREQSLGGDIDVETPLDNVNCFAGKLCSQVDVGVQFPNRGSQRFGIAGGDESRGEAVLEDLGGAADVRRNDR